MEKMGVPAIPMCTKAYTELANLTAAREGMPHLREVFTPHPVGGKSADELAAYLVNPDPVSGIQIMKEIVDDLTRPLSADEKRDRDGIRSPQGRPRTVRTRRMTCKKSFSNNGMTDYMPIIIPTEEKVETMLKGTSHSPDEVLEDAAPRCGLYVRALGIHGEAGRCERCDGGMQAGIFPGGARHGVRRAH